MTYPQSDLTGLAVDEVGMRLLRAAEIIRERGWCQGAYERDGKVCVLGAIRRARIGDIVNTIETQARLRAYLKLPQNLGAVDWNDAPERTVDDVLAALTAAALSHAAQE